MTQCYCFCKVPCRVAAIVAGLLIGILTAFLQITGMITVTAPFLWVAFGIGAAFLLALLSTAAMIEHRDCNPCRCNSLRIILAGILATLLLAVILLAFGVTATSVVSAILVGLLAGALTLIFAGSVCLVKCLTDCET